MTAGALPGLKVIKQDLLVQVPSGKIMIWQTKSDSHRRQQQHNSQLILCVCVCVRIRLGQLNANAASSLT